MTVARVAQVVGVFLLSVLMYASFAVADQTVSDTDMDGSDDLSPPGAAFLYTNVSATLRTSDCTYNTWSHTPGSSYAYPNPPYTWDWSSFNDGDDTRQEGWTKTRLLKNGSPHIYVALAVLPAQPTSEPPCLT